MLRHIAAELIVVFKLISQPFSAITKLLFIFCSWDIDSCGYHGDDGCLFTGGGGYGNPFGPTFATGDTVGAGINYASREFFFT